MQPGLTLYAFQSCPYCRRVFEALEALDLEIEVKDIHLESENRKELVEATGRGTVPVLRIEEDGVVRWLPQSREIVAYLYTRFGEGKTPPRTMRPTRNKLAFLRRSTPARGVARRSHTPGMLAPRALRAGRLDAGRRSVYFAADAMASLDGYIRLGMWGLLLAGAVLGPGMRDPFWLGACALGALRAFSTARRSGSIWHIGIGGVFGLGAVSIALTMAGIVNLPWWYAAYALVAVLAALALWQHLRGRGVDR